MWPPSLENHRVSTAWKNGLLPVLCGGHLCGRTAHLPTERLFGGEGNGDVHLATTCTMDCSQLRGGSLRSNVLHSASLLVLGRAMCVSPKNLLGVLPNGCSVAWLSCSSGHLLTLLVIISCLYDGSLLRVRKGCAFVHDPSSTGNPTGAPGNVCEETAPPYFREQKCSLFPSCLFYISFAPIHCPHLARILQCFEARNYLFPLNKVLPVGAYLDRRNGKFQM